MFQMICGNFPLFYGKDESGHLEILTALGEDNENQYDSCRSDGSLRIAGRAAMRKMACAIFVNAFRIAGENVLLLGQKIVKCGYEKRTN